ncbi:MAG: hypothetical protein PHY42_01985 [Bacilli bacterium]|nr:hypothetical protein [Bacilli bacterium]
MKSERNFNILSMIFIGIIFLFFIMLVVDLDHVNNNEKPTFVIQTRTYEDGSTKYVGLFYTVYHIKVDDFMWELAPWFADMKTIRLIANNDIE